jgi:two-component system, LuxR family, sensor kinase FixL
VKKKQNLNLKLERKLRILDKPGKRLPAKWPKRSNQNRRGVNIRAEKHMRLEGMIDDLNKSRSNLGAIIRRQTNELKIKNGQLRNGENKQQRSDEQIRILFKAIESTADGVFIIGVQKRKFPVVYSNPSFQKMTGYTENEINGRNCFLIFGAEADSRVIAEIKRTIHSGGYFHGEILSLKKNGKKYWNQLRIAPMYSVAGVVTHYIGIQTDNTLMRQRELENIEQREELLHVTRVGKLAEFVSSLAHEISQPLTAILAYAQAARRMLASRETEIREILQHIVNDDERAVEVIRRLRMLLKKSVPEMKPLDINLVINETINLINADAIIRNCAFTTDLMHDLPLIHGDRIQLQQVLLNLLSNSLDAMENIRGSHKILIQTSRLDRSKILVKVKDSGCGIPKGNMPKLFSRFFTSKTDGLGMGLTISRSIIEMHGGQLEAKNNPKRGATFYFTLPIGKKESR